MRAIPLYWDERIVTSPRPIQYGRRISTQAKQQCEACTSRGSSRWKGVLRDRSIVVTVLPHRMPCVKKRSGRVWSYKPRSGYFIATAPQLFIHHLPYISNTWDSYADRFSQSSLVLRFVNNDFQENKEPTIGGTLTQPTISLDTQEKYSMLTPSLQSRLSHTKDLTPKQDHQVRDMGYRRTRTIRLPRTNVLSQCASCSCCI